MRVPDVIGVKLTGALPDGVLATDLALTVTERLRQVDLQDRYVEFFGPGVCNLSAGDRSVVANMTPEFGGNSGYFPIDARTLDYLRTTGRTEGHIEFVEAYAKRVGLWFDPATDPRYTSVIEMDLSKVEASLAGPTRPQDRIALDQTVASIAALGKAAGTDWGEGYAERWRSRHRGDHKLHEHLGSQVGDRGWPPGSKGSPIRVEYRRPGSRRLSRQVRRRLNATFAVQGLMEDLEAVGFGIVGYGCTTCIGNSGPLTERHRHGDVGARNSSRRRPLRKSQFSGSGASATRGGLSCLSATRCRLRAWQAP